MTTTETVTPKVWIGCLAAYNNAHLHGEWIDAAVETDEIWAAQKRVLASSPIPRAEEHYIGDYEGFGDYRVHEYASLTTIAFVARMIEEHGPAFAAWLSDDDSPLDENFSDGEYDEDGLVEAFRESYRGEWESSRDYAEHNVEELGLPYVGYVYKQKRGSFGMVEHESWSDTLDGLSSYLDWDKIERDVLADVTTHDAGGGKIYVFESV
jgi:antirestriction protein